MVEIIILFLVFFERLGLCFYYTVSCVRVSFGYSIYIEVDGNTVLVMVLSDCEWYTR